MNKNELIKAIAKGAGVTHSQAAKMLTAMQETVSNALLHGGKVAIRGFGTFKVSDHCARKYHHPQTGEMRIADAYRAVRFTPSREIKEGLK
jgi:DNA-binding protein HU-beta